jgi:hypothetical protein
MTLGTVRGYEEVTRRITVTGRDTPFHLESINVPTAGWRSRYRVLPGPSPGRSQVVELNIRVPNVPGILAGTIEVKARTGDGPPRVLAIPVSGVVDRQATVSLPKGASVQ